MPEENKDLEMNQEGQALDMDRAKHMTIGEAVRKDSELKAGVTEEDNILDKYIKQHREEVASQKFDTKYSDLETLDTATLDNFIKKQREELAKSEEENVTSQTLLSESLFDEKTVAADATSAAIADASLLAEALDSKSIEAQDKAEPLSESTMTRERSLLSENEKPDKSSSKTKKIVASLIALILLLLAVFFGVNYLKGSSTTNKTVQSSKQTESSKTASTSAAIAKKKNKGFTDAYDAFFTDSKKDKLKNSSFAKLSDLEKTVKDLKGTAYYDKAKEKFDALKKQVTAIQAVNAKFSIEAINDGKKADATIKATANFDDLKGELTNTGNPSLDLLIQSVIKDGRDQLSKKVEAEKAAASQKAEEERKAADQEANAATSQVAGETANNASAANTNTGAPSTQVPYSNHPGLQRHLSRVPYNSAVIADTTNPAWLFNPGILEKIVATSQARGYFSGNNYILEPVTIVNGNGYYNMFKTDGTYLFSINCKTGYFVGNAKGNADNLDY
ncbi:cell division site-positioning protein MapZ family protein [Streptococcus hongkongensis]|nr:membrane protein [Streptococcus uberis]